MSRGYDDRGGSRGTRIFVGGLPSDIRDREVEDIFYKVTRAVDFPPYRSFTKYYEQRYGMGPTQIDLDARSSVVATLAPAEQ